MPPDRVDENSDNSVLFLRIVSLKRDYDSLIIHKSNYNYLIHSQLDLMSQMFLMTQLNQIALNDSLKNRSES